VIIIVFFLSVDEYGPVSTRVLLQFVKYIHVIDIYIVHGARKRGDVKVRIQVTQGAIIHVIVMNEEVLSLYSFYKQKTIVFLKKYRDEMT
jgi:hypothetical protein